MTYQKLIGNRGEELAAKYLEDRGYQLLDEHYITRYGELDLVMLEAGMIVFVEVKTRTSQTFGTPEESITAKKLERIQNAGLLWMQANPDSPDDWRIDVIAIQLDHEKKVEDIQHYINVTL